MALKIRTIYPLALKSHVYSIARAFCEDQLRRADLNVISYAILIKMGSLCSPATASPLIKPAAAASEAENGT